MGRYSEMTYVFDILRENQQFELLFNKGIDKVCTKINFFSGEILSTLHINYLISMFCMGTKTFSLSVICII